MAGRHEYVLAADAARRPDSTALKGAVLALTLTLIGFMAIGPPDLNGDGVPAGAGPISEAPALRSQAVPPVIELEVGRPVPSTANCTLRWIDQPLDHFSHSASGRTYRQRFFFNADSWEVGRGPIFFYVGNEANVEKYVNATGLMWESARPFGAMLVWAEHRFYGESVPAEAGEGRGHPYLTHELALADYAVLIAKLRADFDANASPVFVFGGSYGGKLAAWMRLKYPASVAGAEPCPDT